MVFHTEELFSAHCTAGRLLHYMKNSPAGDVGENGAPWVTGHHGSPGFSRILSNVDKCFQCTKCSLMLDMTRYYHNNNIPATRFVQNRKVCFCSENVTFVQWRKCWFLTVNIILIVFLKNAMGSHTCQEHLAQRYFFYSSKFSVTVEKLSNPSCGAPWVTQSNFTQIHSNLPPPPPNPPTRHALCLFHLNSKTKRICEKKTYFTHLMNFEILHLLPIANPGRASCWDHVWPIFLHF